MNELHSDRWKRQGISLLFDASAMASIAKPREVVPMRDWIRMAGCWPDDPPSNGGQTVVVAGLGACIDLLHPDDCEDWLRTHVVGALSSFQSEYGGDASVVFWVPDGRARIRMNAATDTYTWACAPPHKDETLHLGRVLFGGAERGVARIIDATATNPDPDGPAWIGLHLPRLS